MAATGGWTPVGDAAAWRPDVTGANAELRQAFAKDGRAVTLQVFLFTRQTLGAQAISSRNRIVRSTNRDWRLYGEARDRIDTGSGTLPVNAAVVGTGGRERREVMQWYWVDGRVTASELVAEAYRLPAILRRADDAVAWVVIYTPLAEDRAATRAVLADFAASLRPALDAMLARTAGERS
jgi:EpsI family protein